jgi:hypothetical protein
MTADPNTLMTINAGNCRCDALLNNQALQRKSVKTEMVTPAAQATASLSASISSSGAISIGVNPTPTEKRHLP